MAVNHRSGSNYYYFFEVLAELDNCPSMSPETCSRAYRTRYALLLKYSMLRSCFWSVSFLKFKDLLFEFRLMPFSTRRKSLQWTLPNFQLRFGRQFFAAKFRIALETSTELFKLCHNSARADGIQHKDDSARLKTNVGECVLGLLLVSVGNRPLLILLQIQYFASVGIILFRMQAPPLSPRRCPIPIRPERPCRPA